MPNKKITKAIFVNGGSGRVLSSIPAFEKLVKINEKTDEDFIIVCEGNDELFLNNKLLHKRLYTTEHKNLFRDFIKKSTVITPEPYRNKAYYNQECNIAQGFDLEINGTMSKNQEEYRATIELTQSEITKGKLFVDDIKNQAQKSNVVVFQPFGSGVTSENGRIFDSSGRSISYENVIRILEAINKDSLVFIMSDIDLPTPSHLKVGTLKGSLREWAAVINEADHFLGCDSVGQHIAFCLNKPCTVIFGSTYPENVGYSGAKNYNIIDLGKENREYSPIRILQDTRVDMNNENCFKVTDNNIKEISKNIEETFNNSKIPNFTSNKCDTRKCCK